MTVEAKAGERKQEQQHDSPKIQIDFLCFRRSYRWSCNEACAFYKAHSNQRDIKTVIRCVLAGWLGLLLLIIGPTRAVMHNGAYLLAMLAFILPPSSPFALQVEQIVVAIVLQTIAFAYTSFVIEIGWLARREFKLSAAEFSQLMTSEGRNTVEEIQQVVFGGRFIEAGPSAVHVIFSGVGFGVLLYFRGTIAGSPHTNTTIMTIFQLALPLSISGLYPYRYFAASLTVYIPFLCQMAINLIVSITVFPETLNRRFLSTLIGIISPLENIISSQKEILATDPSSTEWASYASLNEAHSKVLGDLFNLGSVRYLLKSEINVRRLGSRDTRILMDTVRKIAVNTSGFLKFHTLIRRHMSEGPAIDRRKPTLDTFALHISPPSTPRHSVDAHARQESQRSETTAHSHQRESSAQSSGHTPRHTTILNALLRHRHKPNFAPVGIFMSERYHHLEEMIARPEDARQIKELLAQLHKDAIEPIQAIRVALSTTKTILECLQQITLSRKSKPIQLMQEEQAKARKDLRHLRAALAEFNVRRRASLEPLQEKGSDSFKQITYISHRTLYWTLLFQYSLSRVGELTGDLLETTTCLATKKMGKLHISVPSFWKIVTAFQHSRDGDVTEDPEVIAGLKRDELHASDAHFATRHPDALPPSNLAQIAGSFIHRASRIATGKGVMFGFKAAVLHSLLIAPAYIPSNFTFTYYRTRAVWVVILSSMTFDQYAGYTAYGFFFRLVGTLGGGLLGWAIWEAGCNNPYGLAAVTFFSLIPLTFFRLFTKHTPLAIVSLSTFALIIGYGYQNERSSTVNIGSGWSLAWRRFLLTTIGLSASFVAAYLPPRSTEKRMVRAIYSRTMSETAQLFSDVLALMIQPKPRSKAQRSVTANIYAVRSKLRQAKARQAYIDYEVPLRGAWPAEKYRAMQEVQAETVAWTALLAEAVLDLGLNWRHEILRRTRLDDPSYVGQLLHALHTGSLSLREAIPMPALYTPLLEGFYNRPDNGLQVHLDSPEIVFDREITNSMDYLKFTVAVTSVYAILNRVDRMVWLAKDLCGEQFHVHGILDAMGVDAPGTVSEDEDSNSDSDQEQEDIQAAQTAGV